MAKKENTEAPKAPAAADKKAARPKKQTPGPHLPDRLETERLDRLRQRRLEEISDSDDNCKKFEAIVKTRTDELKKAKDNLRKEEEELKELIRAPLEKSQRELFDPDAK